MHYIDEIVNFRNKNGYKINDEKYLEKLKPFIKKSDLFKSEYFLVKYFLSKQKRRAANKWLKKANKSSKNYELFNEYLNCIFLIFNEKEVLEKLKNLRKKVIFNSNFVKEIENLILSVKNDEKFERIEKNWNGIILQFINENDFDESRKTSVDYQSKVCSFIFAFESCKKEMENKILKKDKIFKVLKKCKKTEKICEEFLYFLSENFVTNNFLLKYFEDLQWVCKFFEFLVDFYNCKIIEDNLNFTDENWKIPDSFLCFENELKEYKNNKRVSKNKAREIILNKIRNKLKPEDSNIKIPFLPIYYDIASEYIKYPVEDTKSEGVVSSLLKRFSIFSRKK